MSDVDLAIRLTADASDAAAAFDSVGSAADAMASEVDAASRKADQAANRLDGVADSADNLDDKAGRATGALGALSAGFELAGLEGYATGLQSAAMATDFMSGVGQSLKLVMEAQWVANAKATATTIAHTAAERARAVATKAAAAAQWLMNVAMSANPIGAVIVAVVALVAAFVLAYKRSEKFRNIVQAAMKVATFWVRKVIDIVMALVGWVKDNLPAAWVAMKDRAVAMWAAIADKVVGFFNGLRDKAATVLGWVKDRFTWLRDKLSPITDTIESGIDAAFAPIEWAIDKVQELIDWIGRIDFPDFPDLNPFGKVLGRGAVPTSGGGDTYITNNFDISGVYDSGDVVAAINDLFTRHAIALGYQSA
jgi:phage-related protein